MGYITLAEAKSWLNVTDTSEDTVLLALIEAATSAVEGVADRTFTSATITESYTGMGSKFLFLHRTPITAVTSVSLADSGTTATVDFTKVNIRRTDGGIFPYGEKVVVTYTGGYTTIPQDVKMATKITLQAMRNAQAIDPNLGGEALGGVFYGSFDMYGPGAVPRAARTLLNEYTKRYTAP